jgi:hypothetical protein
MDKIKPLTFIQDVDPVPEAVLSASGWFETEYITIEGWWNYDINAAWGPYMGNALSWFLAQGWVLVSQTCTDVGPTGGVYVYTYNLKRRKLQSERVLNDMIREFTEAYNEGREINDQRYDEIVTLFDVMLDQTEDELIAVAGERTTFTTLMDGLIEQLSSDFTTHESDVQEALTDFGDSHRERVNTQFDAEAAKAQASLVDRGLSNSTVLTSVLAGVEESRAKALNDLEDKISEKVLAAKERLHAVRVGTRNAIMAANERLIAMKERGAMEPTEMRNRILTAMLGFMERRTDEYPGMGTLADLAAKLGYSESPAVVAPQ